MSASPGVSKPFPSLGDPFGSLPQRLARRDGDEAYLAPLARRDGFACSARRLQPALARSTPVSAMPLGRPHGYAIPCRVLCFELLAQSARCRFSACANFLWGTASHRDRWLRLAHDELRRSPVRTTGVRSSPPKVRHLLEVGAGVVQKTVDSKPCDKLGGDLSVPETGELPPSARYVLASWPTSGRLPECFRSGRLGHLPEWTRVGWLATLDRRAARSN
jgi:hypothetical protein